MDAAPTAADLAEARAWIAESDALVVTAGAGMGVDGGLPDFRGARGFWAAYPPFARLGLRFEELADPRLFAEDPHLAWGFYGHRLALYRASAPHAGYRILAGWCAGREHRVATSNVDGHFARAGFAADRTWELHGSIHHLQCAEGCSAGIWPVPAELTVVVDADTMRARELPSCPGCGGLARPNILMFGDARWIARRSDGQARRFHRWFDEIAPRRPLVIECGAGTAIPTIRRLGEAIAARPGGRLLRIGPDLVAVRGEALGLRGSALAVLRALATRRMHPRDEATAPG